MYRKDEGRVQIRVFLDFFFSIKIWVAMGLHLVTYGMLERISGIINVSLFFGMKFPDGKC